ncbi:hypothetical protein [Halalkalicoccus tibetensis]|uniref:Uncharacterized protein n=1 Tax=Halalkalicoccus tibetensis TaxID=175632 RepID=A0ABD5UYM6_9EURY
MAIAQAERRLFGREIDRIERIVLGITGPLLVLAHVVLALTVMALLYALLLPL